MTNEYSFKKGDQLEILRVRLLWQVGRILASHNMLKEELYGQTIGMALKLGLRILRFSKNSFLL